MTNSYIAQAYVIKDYSSLHNLFLVPPLVQLHDGRITEWLKLIHVKGKDLGVVFVKASSILGCSSKKMETVDYLIESGVREWVGIVVTRSPQVLTLTMEELVSRVRFYLDMSMNKEDFGTMVYDYTSVLGFFSLDEMTIRCLHFINTKHFLQPR